MRPLLIASQSAAIFHYQNHCRQFVWHVKFSGPEDANSIVPTSSHPVEPGWSFRLLGLCLLRIKNSGEYFRGLLRIADK